MSNDLETKLDYKKEVNSTAEIIVEEWNEYDQKQPISEAVWETVDSHQWMIYNGYYLDVIKYSDTELQYTDWKAFVNWEDYSWQDVLQAMAFACFESDIQSKVLDLVD